MVLSPELLAKALQVRLTKAFDVTTGASLTQNGCFAVQQERKNHTHTKKTTGFAKDKNGIGQSGNLRTAWHI
jgi:hypothetical protein